MATIITHKHVCPDCEASFDCFEATCKDWLEKVCIICAEEIVKELAGKTGSAPKVKKFRKGNTNAV